jgi:adenylylsulfate kinase
MSMSFALWITGRPGAGKTTLIRTLLERLRKRDIDPVVLSSEFFRQRFSPRPVETEDERAAFYRGLVEVARMFVERGIAVLIDATGMRRSYRAGARESLDGYAEILVDCPPELSGARHSENLSRSAGTLRATAVAEPAVEYEAPVHPEVVVHSDREDPEAEADKVMEFLLMSGLIPSRRWYRI